MEERSFEVTAQDKGLNLYHFLLKHLPGLDRGFLRSLLRTKVRLNGSGHDLGRPLVRGDIVSVTLPEASQAAQRSKKRDSLQILYQDASIFVVNKPAGMLSNPEGPATPSVIDEIRKISGQSEGLRAVHRLDKDTSGVVLVSRDRGARDAMTAQLSEGIFERKFWAIAAGHPIEEEGLIDQDLGPNRKGGGMRVVNQGGKSAQTQWFVRHQYRGYVRIEAIPHPGITHQVRLHLATLGLPIVGDALYGGGTGLMLSDIKPNYREKPGFAEPPLLERMALHAISVRAKSPESGEWIEIEAPLPGELVRVQKAMEKYA